jgi:hypothetical protein
MNSRRLILFYLVLTILAIRGSAAAQVSPTLFDLNLEPGVAEQDPWPVDSFSGFRLWVSGVAWAQMNPSPGVYEWRFFDLWMNHAKQNGVDVLYTFGRTPIWASSEPGDTECGKPGYAYQGIYDWMVGENVDQSCTPKGTVWACGATGYYNGLILWDTSQTCREGKCTYSEYKLKPMYNSCGRVAGGNVPIHDSMVKIGYVPILCSE